MRKVFGFIWALNVRFYVLVQRWLPSNRIIGRIRCRDGLRWGVPAMLLALPCLFAAAVCATQLAHGGPGWLNLIAAVAIWDSFKFLLVGPWSLVLLVCARWSERGRRHRTVRVIA